MDVTIVIASFGEKRWLDLASGRAYESAAAQGVPVVVVHGLALHDARNAGLAQVRGEFVSFLDADDEWAPGAIEALSQGMADLRSPAVSYVRHGRPGPPYIPKVASHHHDCTAECITSGAGNWLIVGTMVRTELVREAGGWRDWPCYEDFCLWMRVLALGATVEAIPQAVYRAHVEEASRNRAPTMAVKNAVHHRIVNANLARTVA